MRLGAAAAPTPTTDADSTEQSNPCSHAFRKKLKHAVENLFGSHFDHKQATASKSLDVLTASYEVEGNKVSMLFDGVNSFAERNRLIDAATESISLQTFIFNSDETGWDLARRLAAKALEGVDVRVVYDALGSKRADPRMFEMMRRAGVQVRAHAPLYRIVDLNNRWHEKHLIIDGKTSIEGGMNIANEYAWGGTGRTVTSRGAPIEAWRDTDIKVQGPAVSQAQKAFIRNWRAVGGKLSDDDLTRLFPSVLADPNGIPVRIVQANPEVKHLDGTTHRLYLAAIDSAKKSITIENAYFLPPKDLRDALVNAAKRGVNVRVLTNSRESNDTAFVSDAARYFYDEMIKGGVKIYEKQGATLHAKTATFDGDFSIVGSVNLNGRSRQQDSEDAVAVSDSVIAQDLEKRFKTGLARSRLITMEELNREPFLDNLRQWAFSTLAWTF